MNANDLENHKILLDDARQTYYNRLSNISNLSTKAGVIAAIIVAFVSLIFEWFTDDSIGLSFKVGVILFLGYASYLSIRVLFSNSKINFISIDKGMRNLNRYPKMNPLEWVKFLISEYKKYIKELHEEYKRRNDILRESSLFILLSFAIYLLSLVLG